jgi:hypothetical protein
VENNLINQLEEKINTLLSVLTELHRQNKQSREEIKKLISLNAEKTKNLEELQTALNNAKQNKDESEILRYQENEKKLKNKIKFLLSKLEELDKLDSIHN